MPDVAAHEVKARDNERFAEGLLCIRSAHTDWIVTALFYAALHHIQRLLHHLGISDDDSGAHWKRKDLLKNDPRLQPEVQLQDDYRHLQDDSEDARYECREFTLDEVGRLRNEQLARVKARVHQLTA